MNEILNLLKKKYSGKKVLIVGLGLQGGGIGMAKFFIEIGAKVRVTDKKTEAQLSFAMEKLRSMDISFTLGKHKLDDFLESDLIFKAPKMRWDDPFIIEAQKKGIAIEMEVAFFASFCPSKIIGVTGTRGKSTTTMMLYKILKKNSGLNIHLAGNISNTSTINLLKTVEPNDLVLLELSSWQLSAFHQKRISPHIAVFTNFYPDHLDYYHKLEEYLYDKKAIYLYQKKGDYLVANKSLSKIISFDKLESKISFFEGKDYPSKLLNQSGSHNSENAAAAVQVAKILNLNINECINDINNFKGLPYRQETIAKTGNIVFVNDTTSTTPIATIKALETFVKKQIVLILGGNSKNLPAKDLISHLKIAKKIILLKGSFTDEIYKELLNLYPDKISKPYDNLELAVKNAYAEAKKLQIINHESPVVVLFSPGATSFAMFNNEFHRGDEYNEIIKSLIHAKEN